MFALARRWGFVPEEHPNPARDIDRFGEDQVRAALEAHGQRLLGVAGKKPAADVIELHKTGDKS